MKLPSERYRKQYVTITSGTCPSAGSSVDITIANSSLYDKIILEIVNESSSIVEGTSYIIELDEDGLPINRVVNIVNRAYHSNWYAIGFFYIYDQSSGTWRLAMKEYSNYSAKNYIIKGILKN